MEERITSTGFLRLEPASTDRWPQISPMNRSEAACSPDYYTMKTLFLDILTIIIALGGLVGNMVVLWLLGFRQQRNPFFVYIFNLAGADVLFFCHLFILNLLQLICYFNSNFNFNFYFFSTLIVFTYLTSMGILSAISTERCLSILSPIWYHCHRPRYMSAVICVLLWALSLLMSILRAIYCGPVIIVDISWCLKFDFFLSTWLIFLFVVLCGSSLALLVKMFSGSQRKKLTRLYVTILSSLLVFLLCGLPFGIYLFLVFWIQEDFNSLLFSWFQFLSCVNSSANPIIYFFVGSFRQWKRLRLQLQLQLPLRMVLQRALQDTPEVDETGGNLPQTTVEPSGDSVV